MTRRNSLGNLVEERIDRDNYMFGRHFFAYEIAKRCVSSNSTVLEAGSGNGYGADFLSYGCNRVIGIDIEIQPLIEARRKYQSGNVNFIQASVLEIPIKSHVADFVCSMQVIEHLDDPKPYLEELARILSKDGTVLITTPFRESKGWRFDKIPSPFHKIEYTGKELEELLFGFFENVEIKGIKFRPDSVAGKSDKDLGSILIYDRLNLRRLIPAFLKPILYRLVGFTPIGKIEMSSSDFELSDDISDEVLDLVAFCSN